MSQGFWGRSLEEFRRLLNIAIKLEGVRGASRPYMLHTFGTPSSLSACKVMSDADLGGFSTAHLDWVPRDSPLKPYFHSPSSKPASASSSSASFSSTSSSFSSPSASTAPSTQNGSEAGAPPRTSPPSKGYARFHGTISTQLPVDMPQVQRTGYAAWRTLDRRPTLLGSSLWDVDPYVYLALRVRSDGRRYLVNVQADGVVPTDLHQHRLFARRPGHWETVLIKWNDFVRTNHGFVVENQSGGMPKRRLRSIGLGLTDRLPGPFDLCVESIWATNDPSGAPEPGGDVLRLDSAAAGVQGLSRESHPLGGGLREEGKGEGDLGTSGGKVEEGGSAPLEEGGQGAGPLRSRSGRNVQW